MSARRLAFGVVLTALIASPAHAEVPSPGVWQRHQEPDTTLSEAAEAFAAGEAAFAAEEFDAAVEQFARAHALKPHPFTAYNLGLAQARAGRSIEAWATFTALRDDAPDPQRRAEAELQLARIAPHVARIEVRASQGQVVRIEGESVPANTVLLRGPGELQLDIAGQSLRVTLVGGELRIIDVRSVDRIVPGPKPRKGRVGVLAATVALGAGTAGAATAAAILGPDGPGRPLGYAAAGLGGATLTLAVTALALHLRDRRTPH